MFSTDSFKRKADKAFSQFAGSASTLTAPEAHSAFLAMGGRPTLPLERIVSLLPAFTFSDTSLMSISAFAKLVDYLSKGPDLQDELDAVYNKVAVLKAEKAAAQHSASKALRRQGSATLKEALRLVESVLDLHGDVYNVPSLLKLAWERAVEEHGGARMASSTRNAVRVSHAPSLQAHAAPPAPPLGGGAQISSSPHEPSPPADSRRATGVLTTAAKVDPTLEIIATQASTIAPRVIAAVEAPSTHLPPAAKRFACFLSHYKVEAASEARWLCQTLEPLLGKRCFLDSDDLLDLSRLRDHVRESACILLLQTRAVLTRPWCIVELLTAIDSGVPIVGVSIVSGAHHYDFDAASTFMTYLDTLLEAETQEQLVALDVDITDAAFKLANTLPNIISVALSMNESRAVLSARLSDIVSALGKAELPVLPSDRDAWLAARGSAPKRPLHGRRNEDEGGAPASIPPEVPTLPEALLPRPDIIAALKARVLDESSTTSATAVTAPPKKQGDLSNTTAAAGLGGVGKTCMAAALVRDDEVRSAFDKICWVSVGQEPDTPSLQQTLHIQLINRPLSDAAKADERLAFGELIAAAKDQAVLLVLDDGKAAESNASMSPSLTSRVRPVSLLRSVGRVACHATQVHRRVRAPLGRGDHHTHALVARRR